MLWADGMGGVARVSYFVVCCWAALLCYNFQRNARCLAPLLKAPPLFDGLDGFFPLLEDLASTVSSIPT